MKCAYIINGVPASGKTTAANEIKAKLVGRTVVHIERDFFREEIFQEKHPGETFSWSRWKFTSANEGEVTTRWNARLQDAFSIGADIIISDTLVQPRRLNALKERLSATGYEVKVITQHIGQLQAINRDAKRGPRSVGMKALASMYDQYREHFVEKFDNPADGVPTVIVDVDGTLAKMGDRSPFDWHRVGEDSPVHFVIAVVQSLSVKHRVVVMSGRDSVCRKETVQWLYENDVPFDWLYMRDANDMRPDTIVKRELYEQLQKDVKSHVMVVIDDRPSVCEMWRDGGLSVMQVGNPYHTF